MAQTLELAGTVERQDLWADEAAPAAVVLLSLEELRALLAKVAERAAPPTAAEADA